MTFPCAIKLYDSSMAEEISLTPAAFRRIWLHTTDVKLTICSNGWNPEKIKNSIYGSAIYLARKKWDPDNILGDLSGPLDRKSLVKCLKHPKMIPCVLTLRTNEVMSCFPASSEPNGNTQEHLLNYLNQYVPQDKTAHSGRIRRIGADGTLTSLQVSKNPGAGNKGKNKEIAHHFLANGIKAIRFLEYGMEVVAVYDPNCIRVLPEDTDLEVPPFSDILAADDSKPVL